MHVCSDFSLMAQQLVRSKLEFQEPSIFQIKSFFFELRSLETMQAIIHFFFHFFLISKKKNYSGKASTFSFITSSHWLGCLWGQREDIFQP